MVVMAESVQEQGLSAGTSELSKEHGEAVGSRRVQMARPDAVPQFRGVRRKPSGAGRYRAHIWVPSRRGAVSLGTFATVQEAAKAYDAAAVELRACMPECTAKKKAAARPDAWTKFRGVYRKRSGKYGAQIRHSNGRSWLGTFDAAEDAARAYDDAAVKLHGARAVTNFKHPREDADAKAEKAGATSQFRGVYRRLNGRYAAQIGHPETKASRTWLGTFVNREGAAVRLLGAAAKTNFEQPPIADDDEESTMDLLSDFPELPALDFLSHSSISGAPLDDSWVSLPPVDDFLNLKDMDFSDVLAP